MGLRSEFRAVCHDCAWYGKWRDSSNTVLEEVKLHKKLKHPDPDIVIEDREKEKS